MGTHDQKGSQNGERPPLAYTTHEHIYFTQDTLNIVIEENNTDNIRLKHNLYNREYIKQDNGKKVVRSPLQIATDW